MALIEIQDVTKVYQMGDVEVNALQGVSFTIHAARWWRSWGRRAAARAR